MIPNIITILIIIASIAFGVISVLGLKNKKIKIIVNILVYLIYIFVGIIASQRIIYKDNRILGYYLFRVSSGSMRNTLKVNDYILVKNQDSYKKGDIITYTLQNRTITHRIVKINGEMVTTKGDANFNIDDPIHKSQIIGKTVYHGTLLNILINPLSYVLISFSTAYLVTNVLMKTNKDSKKTRKN